MIKRLLVAALCFLAPASLLAQVRVELSFEQETYLPREPLHATVIVYNSSGQTLELGKDNDWLSFTVESVDSRLVKDLKPADVQGEFTLPSAHRAKKMVNLAESFDLSRVGRYNVTASVRVAAWGNETFVSKSRPIGITGGVNIWEANFGVPSETPAGKPEIRKYQLVQANHVKALALYVRIMDESEDEVISLYPLGPLLGVSRPDAEVDRWSNLHVLYQDGARSHRYSMITPDGLLLARQTWEVADTLPSLRRDKEGRITVGGGSRRYTSADLPPPELLTEKSAASAGQPAAEPSTPADAKTK